MKKRTSIHLFPLAMVLIVSFAGLSAGQEQSAIDTKDHSKESPPLEKSWCETPKPFEVYLAMPVWTAGLSGDSAVRGVVTNSDVSFTQLFDHLTHVPITLAGGVRFKRWEIFGDGQYMEVGDSVRLPGLLFTDATLHLKSGLLETFVGYRAVNCTTASLTLFAGMRYNYMEGNLRISDNGDARLPRLRELLEVPGKINFSNSVDWVDPVVGVRGKVRVWKAFSLWAEGDVGGFDANSGSAFELRREGLTVVRRPVESSDWSYQIQGGLEIQVTRSISAQLGWRYLKNDYVSGGFQNKTELSGPFLQSGMSF